MLVVVSFIALNPVLEIIHIKLLVLDNNSHCLLYASGPTNMDKWVLVLGDNVGSNVYVDSLEIF